MISKRIISFFTFGIFLVIAGAILKIASARLTSVGKTRRASEVDNSKSGIATTGTISRCQVTSQISQPVELLQHHGLIFDAEQWIVLVNQYGGNPLFLKMAANLIHELFAGNVGEFLTSGTILAGEFEPLVTQWLKHISSLEQILLKCLATYPQGLTREEIQLELTNHASTGNILSALLSLKRRALVETLKVNTQGFLFKPAIPIFQAH